MGKMGKVPRGAAFVPVKPVKKKEAAEEDAKAKVVFFGGKKAVMFGKKEEKKEKLEFANVIPVFNKVKTKGFDGRRYRMWKYSEVMQLDGDIRKGLKDEEKRKNKSKNVLKRASNDAQKYGEAGPLNKAISDYGSEKQLGYALRALERLEQITTPTVYSLSGIVNACVRCGDVPAALQYVTDSEEKWGVTPNEVVMTALMKGLCGDGMQKEATTQLLKMHDKWKIMPNDRMAATLLRGCMRNTDGRSVQLTMAKLDEICFDARHNTSSVEYLIKAMSSDGMVKEAAKYLISNHVNQAACVALATSCVILGETDLAKAALASAKDTGTSSLGFKDTGNRSVSAAMFNRLRDREVAAEIERLDNVLLGVTELSPLPKGVTKYKDDPRVIMLPQKQLDLKALFKNPSLPLRVEVCSGHGEWVVERAASERDKANWIGVEIRPDRVYHAWTRRKLLGAEMEPDNLVLVCGDAREALRLLCGANVQDLFINYPEPPGWMDSKYNLLDDDFFTSVHGTLVTGGAVTMMSDHALYSAFTALKLVKLSRDGLYYSSLPPGNGIPISTDVPSDYGSSYFDRMWLNGKKNKRFFIHYVKPTDAISQQLKNTNAAGADDDAPEARSDDDDEDTEDSEDEGERGPKRRKVVYV